tara:strand:- start:12505 stop:14679 length:2175 start_codon:yes stop_codon:yes gene_type:complete
MTSFDELAASAKSHNPDSDTDLLYRAFEFSAVEHQGQRRQSGEDYITHPLEVAYLVADMKLDDVAIAAGLLHDVVEDTLTSIESVRELFGPEIAHVVEGVTKISTIPFSSLEERQAENFRKLLLAMVDDVRVILVKLADRLHNMRTLQHLGESQKVKISQETLDIYAPIANRLGMNKVKNELEDLALKHLDPEAYGMLQAWVEQRRKATEQTVDDLKFALESQLSHSQIPFIKMEGRLKRLFSIHQKVQGQQANLEEVYDLVALRVITPSIKDCYAILGVIHQMWSPVPGRFKDFVAMPRPNGYQSLHTSVVSDRGFPFEVQIRTEEMHQVAENGIASHWKYKEGRVGAEADEQYFRWLRQLLEWQQEVGDPGEFIHSLKVDLYPEEVYAFTPKGEVKALPKRATPIDFAYSVHTDVGHTCVGARVNGKMVPLRTHLKSGDIVEVVTATGHKPSRDWLNFVGTPRARNRIKNFIHGEEKIRALELGKKILDKEIRRFNLSSKKILDPEKLTALAGELGSKKADDLFAALGYGKLAPGNVLAKLVPQDKLEGASGQTGLRSVVRRVLRPGQDKIKVQGFDDLMVFRARCCNPIRGEKIIGYVTKGKGVSVHAATCSNVLNLFYDPERRIEVVWDKVPKGSKDSSFTVCLTIQVEDRRGILADVTSRIADIKINVRKVEASSSGDNHGRMSITFDITDLKHLQRVIKTVTGVPGVLDVERVLREVS